VHEELIEPNNPASQGRNVGYGTGYLNFGSPESDVPRLTGLRRGLNQTGYVEGRNFVIEYRSAGNQADRLPEIAPGLKRTAIIFNPETAAVST
jgi:hypothetical protein